MQAKTIATLFDTFQRLVWDASIDDLNAWEWENAVETAFTLGGKFTEIDADYSTVTFPDGSSAEIHINGAKVRKAA